MYQLVRHAQTVMTAALLGCALPASAAISPGISTSGTNAAYNGDGELFLSVFDEIAKVSYTLDLGITQNQFFPLATAEAGYQRFWEVADANWDTFLGLVDRNALRWSVLARDATGGNALGALRLYTTLRQGTEQLMIDVDNLVPGAPTGPGKDFTNADFGNGMGSGQAGTFFDALNLSGTHGVSGQPQVYADNGSSVNLDTDPGNSYYGTGSIGLSPTLNSRLKNGSSFDNKVGESSWFYYITRSGTDQLGMVLIDEFDNSGADGYFGFLFVDPTLYPDSPYAGKYLLSYTLDAAGPTPAQREFSQGIGRTEWNIGGHVRALGGLTVAGMTDQPAAWRSQPLGGLTQPASALITSPVPEPGAALLLAAGLAVVARAARRRG